MSLAHAWRCLAGVLMREALRFFHQRERFVAALVRPLIWLLVFAAGFRAALGVSINAIISKVLGRAFNPSLDCIFGTIKVLILLDKIFRESRSCLPIAESKGLTLIKH